MRWQRPPLGWYKLNWDAAFDTQKPSVVGIRAIIRNSEGAVIGTLRTNRHCIADPFTAEAFHWLFIMLLAFANISGSLKLLLKMIHYRLLHSSDNKQPIGAKGDSSPKLQKICSIPSQSG